ncbi:hypothetical protein C3L33_19360, partial [Rhododendron williamsianum]
MTMKTQGRAVTVAEIPAEGLKGLGTKDESKTWEADSIGKHLVEELAPKFMKENGLKHVTFSTADGALEAASTMGIADAIVDLAFVVSRKSLTQRKAVLDITREILERLEAHLRAAGQLTVTANMRGTSPEEVVERVLSQTSLSGLQLDQRQ